MRHELINQDYKKFEAVTLVSALLLAFCFFIFWGLRDAWSSAIGSLYCVVTMKLYHIFFELMTKGEGRKKLAILLFCLKLGILGGLLVGIYLKVIAISILGFVCGLLSLFPAVLIWTVKTSMNSKSAS